MASCKSIKPLNAYSGSGFSDVPPAFEVFQRIDTIQARNARITVVFIPSFFFAGLHFDFISAAPLKRSCK